MSLKVVFLFQSTTQNANPISAMCSSGAYLMQSPPPNPSFLKHRSLRKNSDKFPIFTKCDQWNCGIERRLLEFFCNQLYAPLNRNAINIGGNVILLSNSIFIASLLPPQVNKEICNFFKLLNKLFEDFSTFQNITF